MKGPGCAWQTRHSPAALAPAVVAAAVAAAAAAAAAAGGKSPDEEEKAEEDGAEQGEKQGIALLHPGAAAAPPTAPGAQLLPLADRRLLVTGRNTRGQCLVRGDGGGGGGGVIGVPTMAPLGWLGAGRRVVRAATGGSHTLLLDDNARVYAVGSNEIGQLGRGHHDADDPHTRIPRPVAGIDRARIVQVAAGHSHSGAVAESGQLFMWGYSGRGQCGTGATDDSVLAATRCALGAFDDGGAGEASGVRVVSVACGGGHTVAATSDGGVVVFGNNDRGQLGAAEASEVLIPERLACEVLDGVCIVGCAAGNDSAFLVSDDGRVFAMGRNDNSQLGLGHTTDANTPTELDAAHFGGAPIVAVACGVYHTLLLTRAGALHACGLGMLGATGLGDDMHAERAPQPVLAPLAGVRVVRIAAGFNRSCALTADGRVFSFGNGSGVPAAGVRGIPQLLRHALADTTVCALGGGCFADHSIFVAGTPPAEPGFDPPVFSCAWRRRRTLLLCLVGAQRQLCAAAGVEGEAAAAAPATLPQGALLRRFAALPEELWKSVFRYL